MRTKECTGDGVLLNDGEIGGVGDKVGVVLIALCGQSSGLVMKNPGARNLTASSTQKFEPACSRK